MRIRHRERRQHQQAVLELSLIIVASNLFTSGPCAFNNCAEAFSSRCIISPDSLRRRTRSRDGNPLFSFTSPLPSDTRSSAIGTKIRSSLVIPGSAPPSMLLPILGYDADSICYKYDRQPLVVGYRLNTLGFPLLGWYLSLLMDRTLGNSNLEAVQRKRGSELREHLVRSGSVALIKSGQALSLRPDLIKNKIWAEELGKLVDEVGAFSDGRAMDIIGVELEDIRPRVEAARRSLQKTKTMAGRTTKNKNSRGKSRLQQKIDKDAILSLFEFTNDNRAVASASIGQVYKARLKRGPALEAAIGKKEAKRWGGKYVAVKVQRPDAAESASLDMYLLRRAAMWLSKFRGGNLQAIADQFGKQLFGELDYIREADNCECFHSLYSRDENIVVPRACIGLTRKKIMVMEWMEGTKGPWPGNEGIQMVKVGLGCCVDQLLNTGIFHADPHRGNLLKTEQNKLAFIDFGMMADVSEEERYGLIGLVIGLQNKDLPLITENLLKLGFLKDTTQLDLLVPRLRKAFLNSTPTGKASDVNFAKLQAELDNISRENIVEFNIPPFFTIIIRSLTMLEGLALSVDSNFRLVRGAYPYVLKQLLSIDQNGESTQHFNEQGVVSSTPLALSNLLVRLLTTDGKGQRIDWERLLSFLKLAQKATNTYDPSREEADDKASISRTTIDLFLKFMTSKTGLFLKTPLVHEVAEAIDGMASSGEHNILLISRGLIRPLPGGNGPINSQRMKEIQSLLDMVQSAVAGGGNPLQQRKETTERFMAILRELTSIVKDDKRRQEAAPILAEVSSVAQMVAVEILEIRGTRAMRDVLQLRAT